jgi:hypothetical protein
MTSDLSYAEKWDDYRRRKRLCWVLFLTYVPGRFAIGLALGRLFSSELPLGIVAGMWMLALLIAGNSAIAWRCPRCGKPFFRRWWRYNSLARECLHCKLPKWSTEAVNAT